MLLKTENFIEEERNAPLLNMNLDDYLKTKMLENMDIQAEKWRKIMQVHDSTKEPREKVELLETPRIIYLDAERTFLEEKHRKQLVNFLTRVISHTKGDYSQAISYVAGFLLLVLDEDAALEIILRLNAEPKYIPGYWREEPVAAATDAYVFQHFLQRYFPKVATHLANLQLFPENYCQKWFGGLCIQILPFEALYPYFTNFLEIGYKYLFQFGLSIVDLLQEQLLAANDFVTVFALLRLDPKYIVISSKAPTNDKLKHLQPETLVQRALDFEVSDVDYPKLRAELYEKHLKSRMEQAKKFAQQSKEQEPSDDESGDEEGEDCELCHEMFPEFLCLECNKKLCETCHTKGRKNHKPTHKVEDYEIPDSDEEVDKLADTLKTKTKI